ncbi:MAG: carbon-nitrogen hydrolase [Deltaproteobacteria bacterium]|nr:carbon-nitrogen hydrolase [Deltaproteobacteria bacterium]
MSRVRRIGLVQQAVGDDPERNLLRAEQAIREAASRGAELVCLQELFRTRYFCQREDAALFDLAESIPGPTTERMSKLAADCGVVLVVPVFERRAAGLYHNSAIVIERDGTIRGHYRKMHIPDDPLFYEKFYFAPGDLGFHCIDTSVGRIGVLICWDQWFPEAARLMAMDGAELLFYPTAIAYLDGETDEENAAMRESWLTVQRGHAIANGVFVCAANRVGREERLRFWGSSFVADPRGQLIAQADDSSEQVLVVECDLARIESQRRGWPFLRDRRIDAYGELLSRFRR